MHGDRCIFVIIQSGSPQESILQHKPERFHQMLRCAGIGAEPYDVSRVRGDFRVKEDDIEHTLRQ